MSSLPRTGLCALTLERDGSAENSGDLGRDLRAPGSLREGSTGGGPRVRDQLPEVDLWHSLSGTSFAGVPAAQIWADFVLWESLLNERDYDSIIELGTFCGGFSLYLASQAEHRGMSFRTYDVQAPERKIPGFVQIDIFASQVEIGEHMQRHDPVIVLCDGGNKPRELTTFSRYVTPASTLVVHDWGTEMNRENIPDNVEMVHEDYCVQLGSLSRVFRVRND